MRRGFLYLVAVMDRATRKVLAWRLSNTMDADISHRGARGGAGPAWAARHVQHRPEPAPDPDPGAASSRALGSRRSSKTPASGSRWMGAAAGWTTLGRSLGPVAFAASIIERLWRSVKYECVHLHAFETGSEARAGIGRWMSYYNAERPHSALGGRTPNKAHADPAIINAAA